jgi:methyl-accepting chemotaxis protein
METKVATALAKGKVDEAAASLVGDINGQLGGAKPAFALVFASTQQPLEQLMPALASRLPGVTLLGASTAGEFTERGDAKGSVALFAVAGDFAIAAGFATGLKDDPEAAVAKAAAAVPSSRAGFPCSTAILLLDPLAGRGEEATLFAAALLGETVRLAGGAAGDDLKMAATHVALDGKVASDAIVLARIFSKKPLGVGVCHGHRALSDSLKVTRADGNVVHEIDGRPAWTVWAERTRASAGARGVDPDRLAGDEVTPYLLRYEAGLATGSELKIRAPLSKTEDGAISFACGIPQGAVIRITDTEAEAQVASAREAARRARTQLGATPAGAVVFDCICRNLILGGEFQRAVKEISDELGGARVAGFETYGEIALDAGDMSGFHNTTTVVLAFPS